MTLLAALAGRVPGLWVGVAVASNTFRHPAVLAKAATVLDQVTGGRFVLGLGAGWHAGEHEQFGIPLPALRERFDRFESAVGVVSALFSEAARRPPGVTLDDPFYPLREATNEPPPVRPEGPAIWLGGQQRRGIALAARYAEGWVMPGNRPGDVAYFSQKRDEIRRALEAVGRDPDDFTFAGQLNAGGSPRERREGRETALEFLRAGADHLIIGVPGRLGADGLRGMATEVARPARDAAG
jgi:alkanesulfonate monooxygenase SsuD/methylene tetrahydromethanopterin reductase-like flavin-dependent oxidoreductase (luciferase family)